MKYRLIIFDLDGTLLNTIGDLTDSVNHVLSMHGMPARTVSEVRQAMSMALKRWYKAGRRPALLENLESLENLEHLENLDNLENIGNLSPEERQILQQACSEKNN